MRVSNWERAPVDFDEANYERRLQRWAALDLPMFRIEVWPGACRGAASGALLSTSKGVTTRSVKMWGTVGLYLQGSPTEVRVTSSRPDGDEEMRRHSALTKMAIQIVGGQADDAPAEERNRRVFELADRLRAGDYPWTRGTVVVDETAIEVDVLVVGDVWAAFGDLDDDVWIDIQGHGIPFADFRLVQIPPTELNLFDEDDRWSARAERFLMARRWVPNFLIGWTTWFGNRKASGLRGIPGDLAFLWSTIFERSHSDD